MKTLIVTTSIMILTDKINFGILLKIASLIAKIHISLLQLTQKYFITTYENVQYFGYEPAKCNLDFYFLKGD